ncbi:MAG: transposase [Patescibacteria group bacterium]
MTTYAIAHAPKGATFIVSGEIDKPACVRLKDDPAAAPKARAKASFIEKLEPGDVVLLEMGGAADRLALACFAYGATVLRYPSFLLNKEACDRVINACGYRFREEKAREGETGEKLTARKTRAYALFGLHTVAPEGFYPVEPKDVSILRLKLGWRSYERSYKATMRSYQGLLAAYRDQAFVELAFARQLKADALEEEIHNLILEKLVEDILGGEISDTERQDFFALIGKEFEGGRFPERATEDTIAKLVNALLESDAFKATVFGRLKSQKKSIEKMLKGGRIGRKGEAFEPNEIYAKVFEPIPGCGPLIGARFISAISDIRRFESLPALKAYAGYHHFEDGSRACRRAGHVSNWNTALKQAVYLLCDMTVKNVSSPWRAKLDQRKAYELVKLLRDRQAKADELGLEVEILPAEFRREITSYLDVELADFGKLSTHILALQERAGVAWKGDDAEDTVEVDSDDEEAGAEVKDPRLGKLVRGLKGVAHNKGLRWLGQQFLKHVWFEWRRAVGIHDSVRVPPPAPVKPRATGNSIASVLEAVAPAE